MKLFKDSEVLIGVINLGIALFFRDKETDLLKSLQLALDVTGILANEFCEATNMSFKIWILCIDHYDLASNSGGDKYV